MKTIKLVTIQVTCIEIVVSVQQERQATIRQVRLLAAERLERSD